MGARPLTALGIQMRDSLPVVLRGSADYLAVLHPCAREVARLEASIEQVRAQFNPQSADILLSAWEVQVRLPAGGGGGSTAQRQAKVLARLRKLLGSSEGREWEALVTDLVGSSGWTYEEHVPGDPASPPADTLRIQLPFPPDGPAYIEALGAIREVTPSHLEIEFESLGGFLFDESHLDLEEFTY